MDGAGVPACEARAAVVIDKAWLLVAAGTTVRATFGVFRLARTTIWIGTEAPGTAGVRDAAATLAVSIIGAAKSLVVARP